MRQLQRTLLLAALLILTTDLFAQSPQSLTYNLDNNKPSFNSPAQPGSFTLSSPIAIKLLSTHLSLLQKVEFLDNANHVAATLQPADLGIQVGKISVIITVNTDKTIAAKPSLSVAFPMNIRFTFNGQTATTGLIGQSTVSLPPVSPTIPPPSTVAAGVTHIPYYDAITIVQLIRKGEGSSLISFFNQSGYFTGDSIKTLTDLKNAVASNNFLNQVIAPLTKEQLNIAAGQSGFASLSPTALAGASVTNFADGLAKFLVARFKQELTMAFFKRFKDDLNNPSYGDLKLLFPHTWQTLQTIDQNIYQFSIYLNTLRSAFIQDLTNGYTNLQNVLQQQKYKDWFQRTHPELGTILYSSLYFINGLSAGQHPGAVLANFNPQQYIRLCNTCDTATTSLQTNIRTSIGAVQLLSASIRSLSSTTYWVSADSVRQLTADPMTFKVYLGLLYQQALQPPTGATAPLAFSVYNTTTKVYDSLTITSLLNKVAAAGSVDSLFAYQSFIEALADKATELNEAVADLKAKKKSEIDYNDYDKLFGASLDLLGQVSNFVNLPWLISNPQAKEDIQRVTTTLIFVARSAGSVYVDVRTKNYSSAIQNVAAVLDSLQVGSGNFRGKLLTYGSFIAAVAEAQNSDQVQQAIESVALPVGSYTIKQHSAFNCSLNGYVGYAFDFNHGMSSGIYAPVGVSFSTALGGKKNLGALTLFGSLLDIGGIVAYRLNDASDSLKQNVRLESILSPSAQLIYEFPNVPLCICIGWRMTPKLFYSNNTSFQSVSPRNVLNISALIDIPLFTISNRTKS